MQIDLIVEFQLHVEDIEVFHSNKVLNHFFCKLVRFQVSNQLRRTFYKEH